jgi:cellulose synthase/poly-beta-1,6-N-acetylglucosamine synthase-like glycosyltransferase
MTALLTILMWLIGLAMLGAVGVLLVQLCANLLPQGGVALPMAEAIPSSYVVLMPAHDEAEIIEAEVTAALAQLSPEGRLLAIADNCSDDTAARARKAGAEVIERNDPVLRGKGHALAYGIAALADNPPQVVLVLDADCRAEPGAFKILAAEANRLQRPVQGTYAMLPADGGLNQRIAAFAWDLNTRVRPEGFRRLGLPCQLMGSGMAFPWPLLKKVNFATGHIVEDLKLGLDFAEQRAAAVFVPHAVVKSTFPSNQQGAQSQRRRWEHGHLSTIVTTAPRLLWRSLTRTNGQLLALTVDMCVPPLALLGMLLVSNLVLAQILVWLGAVPAAIGVLSLSLVGLFVAVVLLGWWFAGRRWLSIGELLAAPLYILKKVPLYLSFLTKRQMGWVRTKRD